MIIDEWWWPMSVAMNEIGSGRFGLGLDERRNKG